MTKLFLNKAIIYIINFNWQFIFNERRKVIRIDGRTDLCIFIQIYLIYHALQSVISGLSFSKRNDATFFQVSLKI